MSRRNRNTARSWSGRDAADGTLVRNWVVADTGGATSIGWDGRDSAGRVVPDGTYTLRVTPVDPWGNAGASAYRTVVVVAALRSVTTSRAAFYPQDGDSLAKTTSLSLTLARPMTVTWTVRNAAGAIVVTHLAAAQVAGRDPDVELRRARRGRHDAAGRPLLGVGVRD